MKYDCNARFVPMAPLDATAVVEAKFDCANYFVKHRGVHRGYTRYPSDRIYPFTQLWINVEIKPIFKARMSRQFVEVSRTVRVCACKLAYE